MVGIVTLLIIVPIIIGILNLVIKNIKYFSEVTTLIGLVLNIFYVTTLFNDNKFYYFRWASFDMQFNISTGLFNVILMFLLSIVSIIIYSYNLEDLKDTENKNYFYGYFIISIALCNGTFLAENLMVFLFFVVALSIPLLGIVLISDKQNQALSQKAFTVFSIASLCLMFGISIIEITQKTLNISKLNINIDKLALLAFMLIFIDILTKSSFFPFQFWTVNLTNADKVSYLLIFPTLILGLVGMHTAKVFLLDIFNLSNGNITNYICMFLSIGIIILTVLAFLQTDFRKLISYIFATQVGFSLMGLTIGGSHGTVGGVLNIINAIVIILGFYMISGMASYKNRIITMLYAIFTLSFIGVPMFGGYYGHKLIYQALYNQNNLYFAILVISTFVLGLTLTRFIYCLFKKEKDTLGINYIKLIPTFILAVFTMILGILNNQIINIISLALNVNFEHYNIGFIDLINFLIVIQLIVIQFLRFRKKQNEYFNTNCLNIVNNSKIQSEKIDVYQLGIDVVQGISITSFYIDRAINWFYDIFLVNGIFRLSKIIKKVHTGNFSVYVILSILGFICILLYVL